MFKTMKKRIKNEKGLTLIELLAVIVILAIVAAIAIPAIGNIINNSEIKAAKADVANVLSAANIYFTDNGTAESTSITGTDMEDYVDSWGVLTPANVTVTKGSPNTLTVTGTITVAGETVTIEDATVDNLEVDSADPSDGFDF